MIELRNITKSYPLQGLARYTVLRDLSLTLPSRKHIGIVGRNGAGKSTLLRIIGGLEMPDRGTVRSEGSISPPLGLTSGFAQKISGRDNARFVCRICGDDAATARERVAFIRQFSELGDFFDRPVETYSSGMKARLAFAISMSFDYDYYLIDELTAVGDARFREKAKKAFAEKKGRSSIIMVSHSLDALRRDCEAGLYVKAGQVRYYDDIKQAIEDYLKDQQN